MAWVIRVADRVMSQMANLVVAPGGTYSPEVAGWRPVRRPRIPLPLVLVGWDASTRRCPRRSVVAARPLTPFHHAH